MANNDRAKQFAPFASLSGYFDVIRQQERTVTPKRNLTDEEIFEISKVLSSIKKGDIVEITHYDNDAYIKTKGAVLEVVEVYKKIRLINNEIYFDDILNITIEDN